MPNSADVASLSVSKKSDEIQLKFLTRGPCICCVPDIPEGWDLYPMVRSIFFLHACTVCAITTITNLTLLSLFLCIISLTPHGYTMHPQTLSGYRVNYTPMMALKSIFETNHNHLYIIWSDLAPCLLFICMAIAHFSSQRYATAPYDLQLVEAGVFFAVIMCRFWSGFFHIFNCTSLWSSQRLINIDFFGITAMGFVGPYFYLLSWGPGDGSKQSLSAPGFENYNMIIFICMGLCFVTFTYQLFFGENKYTRFLQQPLLCGLFLWCNVPAIWVLQQPAYPAYVHAFTVTSILGMCGGYAVFYKGLLPERLYEVGASDGLWWNSHVIWHLLGSMAQFCYILVPMLIGNAALR